MRLTFWGVRGSVQAPDRQTWRYGGNTPCLLIRCGERSIIIDAGTGIRELGHHLSGGGKAVEATLLLTHYHWDQIQGLPFFEPIYVPGNKLDIFGPTPQGERSKTLKQAFGVLFGAPFFPVTASQLRCDCTLKEVKQADDFKVGSTRIRTCPVNHPQGALAYRLDDDTTSVMYAADHAPGNPELDGRLAKLAAGADVVICDVRCCLKEKGAKPAALGFGELAMQSGVKSIFLCQHEAMGGDHDMDRAIRRVRLEFPATYAATEAMTVDADSGGIRVSWRGARLGQRIAMDIPVHVEVGAKEHRERNEARLQDLSFYGAYLISPHPFEAEEPIEILVPLQSEDGREVCLKGYVLRVEPHADRALKDWHGIIVHFPAPPRE